MTTKLYQEMIAAQVAEDEAVKDPSVQFIPGYILRAVTNAENAYHTALQNARQTWLTYNTWEDIKEDAAINADQTCGAESDPTTDKLWWYEIALATAKLDPRNV